MDAELLELDPHTDQPFLEDGEQRPGEPDKWYRRFQRYCQLGPGRSLLRCYQMAMEEKDTRARRGDGAPPKRSHTPAIWRRYAAQFEWDRRARTYDQQQQQQVDHTMHQTLLSTCSDLQEVRQFYLDLMRGWIRSPQGEMVPVTDIYQRRMAAKALQTLVSMLRTMLLGDESLQELDQIEITEILAHQPEQNQPDDQHPGRGMVSDLPISAHPTF